MQFPSYTKVVKGKTLTSADNTFTANGELLFSSPTKNPPPNFDNLDFQSPSPDTLASLIKPAGESAIERELFPYKIRINVSALSNEDAAKCLDIAIASPYDRIELGTSPAQLATLPPAAVRHVTTFEFDGCYQDYDTVSKFAKKSRVIERPSLENIGKVMTTFFSDLAWGVKTVDIRPPAGLGDKQRLVYWLRYAEQLVHNLKGGASLKSYSFDSLIEPMMSLYYRLDKRTDGDELWKHYADSSEQFDAAFWAYSELHANVPAIDKERRKV